MLLRLVPVPTHRQLHITGVDYSLRIPTYPLARPSPFAATPFSSLLVRLPSVSVVMSPRAVRPPAAPYRSGRCEAAASFSCRSPRSSWTWVLAAAAVAVSSLATIVRPAAAHSFLTQPLPAWEAVAGCRVGGTPGFMYNCKGPCPNAGGYGLRDGLDEAHPTAVWARGESVEIRWARYVLGGGWRGRRARG